MPADIATPPFIHPHANYGYLLLVTLQTLICKCAQDTWIMPVEVEPDQAAAGMLRVVSTCYAPLGYLGSPIIILEAHRLPSVPVSVVGQEKKNIPVKLKLVEPSSIFVDPRSNMQAFFERSRGRSYDGAQLSFEAVVDVFQKHLPGLHPKLVGFAKALDHEALAARGLDTDIATLYFMLRDEAPLESTNPDDETVTHYFKLLWSSPASFNARKLTKK